MKNLILIFAFAISFGANGQLQDGSIAPDFTLTDYYGTTHTLYNYLDSGKTVFVEIFAAHCPSCWAYHQTHRLKNIYNLYGPNGTDEIMVLALEYDQYNDSNAFTGNHDPWVTAGNWLADTPYPIFNVESADRSVFANYNVTFYPVIYKVCPDKILERMNTSTNEAQLYQKVQGCQAMSIAEEKVTVKIYFDQHSRSLTVISSEDIQSLTIINLQGKTIQTLDSIQDSTISLAELPDGVYVFVFETASGSVAKKFSVF